MIFHMGSNLAYRDDEIEAMELLHVRKRGLRRHQIVACFLAETVERMVRVVAGSKKLFVFLLNAHPCVDKGR